jgi:hypothetical protein
MQAATIQVWIQLSAATAAVMIQPFCSNQAAADDDSINDRVRAYSVTYPLPEMALACTLLSNSA